MNMEEVINSVEKEDFSEFSRKVKQSLDDKIRSHKDFDDVANKVQQMDKTKNAFAEISKTLDRKSDDSDDSDGGEQ